jgi:hypothetical protein
MPAVPHTADRAWRIVPLEIAAAWRPDLPAIAGEMADEIQRSVPEYARSQDSAYARTVLMGAEKTLRDFVELVTEGGAPAEPVAEVFRRLGRYEARCDRGLDPLQTAMHVGAEVLWRRLSQRGLGLGMTDEQLCRMAEALLAHFRQNATAAAEGYVEAQTRLATEVQRRRRRVLELLLTDPPVSSAAIAQVARAADWVLPETVAVVVLHDRGGENFGSLDLPDDVLVDFGRSQPCLVVPEPAKAGRTRMLNAALRGYLAAVGPPLPLVDAAKSLRWAQQAISLAERGVIDGGATIHCAEHMATLIILQNEELIDTLATLRLAPLAGLRPGQRDRLAETLLAWLQTGGDAGEVAARLYVHPQTVRYRIRQLQQLFGDRLRDPDVRLELELVLRAHRLRNAAATR